jgi:hypothetical protein
VTHRRRIHRAAVLAVGTLAAVSLSACGHKIANPTTADTEGSYVRAGDLTYQVQISRQLNPSAAEDHQYLSGVTATGPTPDQQWFAVFLWAKNETHRVLTTTNSFDIVDTQGNKYYPVPINASTNPYAWTSQTLRPLATEPAPDTVASFGPTQGLELLFRLNNAVTANRPLTFEIHAANQAEPSSISLDL